MERKMNYSPAHDKLICKSETATSMHRDRTERFQGLGVALKQAQAFAVLSLWFSLAFTTKVDRGTINPDRQRLMLVVRGRQTMGLHGWTV